jgi:hypothetical protein
MSATQSAAAAKNELDSAVEKAIKNLDDLLKNKARQEAYEAQPYIFDEVRRALNVKDDGSHVLMAVG